MSEASSSRDDHLPKRSRAETSTETRQEDLTLSGIPRPQVLAFRVCCEELDRALKHGFLELDHVYAELIFPRQKVAEDARISNLLTGEIYKSEEFTFSYHVEYCPFCGLKLDDYDQEFAEE